MFWNVPRSIGLPILDILLWSLYQAGAMKLVLEKDMLKIVTSSAKTKGVRSYEEEEKKVEILVS